jgi:hypothetical protein
LCVLAAALLAGCDNSSGSPLSGNGGFTWTGIDAEDFGAFTANNITRFQAANAPQWNTALTAIEAGGNNANYVITLTGNFAIPGGSTFGSVTGLKVSLRGGQTLSLDSGSMGNLLRPRPGQTLILRSALQGHSTNIAPLVYVEAGGSLFMKTGAAIKDNATIGVYVYGGTFTMSGSAVISGNTSISGGGGVYVFGGTFTMSDSAEISGNKVSGVGGGGVNVYNGTFTMSGSAEISGNEAGDNGGGVYVLDGTFTMSGSAEISGNKAGSQGGGVYVFGGTFTKSGSSVIYGDSPAATTTAQTAGPDANTATRTSDPGKNGHAVFYYSGTNSFYRNETLNIGDNPDTATDTFPTTSSQTAGCWTMW